MPLSAQQIIALQAIPGVGRKTILKIGASVRKAPSLEDLFEIVKSKGVKVNNPDGAKEIIRLDHFKSAMEKAELVIKQSEEKDIKCISYYDNSFPQSLRDTKDESGKKSEPPVLLYCKGDISVMNTPCLAIIGTRNPTSEAIRAGRYVSEEFAKKGFTIVSGLALGCDSLAHEGALNCNARTAAFLAHGLDTVYPDKNVHLAERILKNGGLLMAEYPVGTPVSKYNLVDRDRLQAGLALATIVIQTGEKGGTMHAAKATANSGKPLYVIKFSDEETDMLEETKGNHLLFRNYGAKFIRGASNFDEIANSILSRKKAMVQNSLL